MSFRARHHSGRSTELIVFDVHIVILPLLEEDEGFREESGHARGLVAGEPQHCLCLQEAAVLPSWEG